MLAKLSQATIYSAVDELVGILGIRENTDHWPLVDLASRKKTGECAQRVATELGLPIRIDLSFVSSSDTPGTGTRFQSRDLVETGRSGESGGGIVAQVSVPDGLPLFGSADLVGYPISIRLSPDCHRTPKTLVAILAHELSHILLYSLRHPKAGSDLHVDLVPLILGFRDVVESGRKLEESRPGWGPTGYATVTTTTTFGYLGDYQYLCAKERVAKALKQARNLKRRLQRRASSASHAHHSAVNTLARFHRYVDYVDAHPPKRVRKDDAARLVQFHVPDYSRATELTLRQVGTTISDVVRYEHPLRHYFPQRLESSLRQADACSTEVVSINRVLDQDIKTVGRYVSVPFKLRSLIQRARPAI